MTAATSMMLEFARILFTRYTMKEEHHLHMFYTGEGYTDTDIITVEIRRTNHKFRINRLVGLVTLHSDRLTIATYGNAHRRDNLAGKTQQLTIIYYNDPNFIERLDRFMSQYTIIKREDDDRS